MKRNRNRPGELIFPAIAIIASFIYLWEVRDISNPDMNLILVTPLAWAVILISAYTAITSYVSSRRVKELETASPLSQESEPSRPELESDTQEESLKSQLSSRGTRRSLAWIGCFIIYILLLDTIGFLFATPIFIAGIMLILNVRSIIQLVAVPIVTAAAFHVLFVELLGVRLP